MSKTKILATIFLCCFALLSFAISCYSVAYLFSNGDNYTEEYRIYSEIKDYTSLTELRGKLQSLNVEYEIADGKLTLEEYAHISFNVNSGDLCHVFEDSYMQNFKTIDSEDFSVVEVSTELEDGKIIETFYLKDGSTIFNKEGNNYYGKHVSVALILFSVSLAVGLIFVSVAFTPSSKKDNKPNASKKATAKKSTVKKDTSEE